MVTKEESTDDWLEAVIALNVCLHAQGKLEEATDGLVELLSDETLVCNSFLTGCIHRALGNVYRSANKFHEAEIELEKAVDIASKLNDMVKRTEWLADLGRVYRSAGLHSKALEFQMEAYEGALQRGDVALLASVCGEIGFTNYSLKQPNHIEAIRYLGVRFLLARDVLDDKASIRWCLNNLGKVYHSMMVLTPAIKCFQQSLELVEGTGNLLGEGTAYGNLGSVLRDAGRNEEAVKYHKLYLVNATTRLDIGGEAIMLRELAFDYFLMEDYVNCREYALRGLLMVEHIRSTFTQSDDQLKLGNHEKNEFRIFNILQLVLVRLGQFREALLVSEMARARAVFDLMVGVKQDKSKFKVQGADIVDEDAMDFNAENIEKKCEELKKMAATLSSNMIMYSIVEEPVLVRSEKQSATKQKWLYIWLVNDEEISFAGKTITNSVFDLNVEKNYLTTLKRDIGLKKKRLDKPKPAAPQSMDTNSSIKQDISLNDSQESHKIAERQDDTVMADTSEPYNYLIKPVQGHFKSMYSGPIQRLVIIPHGFLYLIPFASLRKEGQYLIEKYVVSYTQSFSILSLLIEGVRADGQDGGIKCSPHPLVIGNPTLPVNVEDIKELKGAEEEALEIKSIMGGETLIGDEARKETIIRALPGRQLVHFASHALLGDSLIEHELALDSDRVNKADLTGDYSIKGAIVLAKSNESCSGILTSSELQSTDLSSCQLMTLSCCRSARGTISGDGVLGLSRALLVGGVKCVVSTLWAIEDEATVDLMKVFYRKYKDCNDAPAAMRLAMLHLINNGFHSNQWSAFTVTGVSHGMIQKRI